MARLSQGDIARRVNRRIHDFVHRSANRKLLPGTGYYSTPFRGGLFGETESDAVAKRLSRSGVDVLWLGTNPCVERSLENIIHPPTAGATFRPSSIRWSRDAEPVCLHIQTSPERFSPTRSTPSSILRSPC